MMVESAVYLNIVQKITLLLHTKQGNFYFLIIFQVNVANI